MLNRMVPQIAADLFEAVPGLTILHQSGGRHVEGTRQAYLQSTELRGKWSASWTVEPFLDDMPARFAAASLVLCRSGASTMAELAAAQKPALAHSVSASRRRSPALQCRSFREGRRRRHAGRIGIDAAAVTRGIDSPPPASRSPGRHGREISRSRPRRRRRLDRRADQEFSEIVTITRWCKGEMVFMRQL